MALIRLGPIVADIRGSISGVVYSRNRGGAYVRSRITPLNPQSPRQVAVRAALADFAQRWSNVLTQAQRDSWDLYAANVPLNNSLGEPRNITGLNMYIRSNSLLLDTEATLVDDGPVIFTLGPTIVPTLTLDAAADTVVITDLGDYVLSDGPVNMLIQQGTPQNAGVQFFKSPFIRVGSDNFVETANEPPSSAFALEHEIAVGQAAFFRTATVTDDGRVGVPVIQRFLVA